MGFTLDKVVPWGRSYEEYVGMFGLSDAELRLRILGCGDGPAAFNAKLSREGGSVVSVDPLYEFDALQIRGRISETYGTVMEQVRKNQSAYVWESIKSVEELGRVRMSAMESFLSDFEDGRREGRYVAGGLPSLPFGDREFDIALSSHFLFLYSGHLTEEFHIKSIHEMLRVAHEARIFPLVALDGSPSPHPGPIMEHFSNQGFEVFIRRVPYEFQRGGNEMLRIKRGCV